MIAETIASTGKEVICLGQIAEMSDRVKRAVASWSLCRRSVGTSGERE
jgi:hypothetical protein